MVRARIYSGEATEQDPGRVQNLLDLRRPETGGELMHFLPAVICIRCVLPDLAALEVPRRSCRNR